MNASFIASAGHIFTQAGAISDVIIVNPGFLRRAQQKLLSHFGEAGAAIFLIK
jgi:hypothetical protein